MDEQFIELIRKYTASDIEIIETSNLRDDLGISSLGMFSLVCEMEQVYNKKINIIELVNVKTIGQLYKIFIQ